MSTRDSWHAAVFRGWIPEVESLDPWKVSRDAEIEGFWEQNDEQQEHYLFHEERYHLQI